MGTLRLSATGLEIDGDHPWHRLLGFVDCVLRGVGQVMFQGNSYAGLLFIIGIGYNSLLFAVAVVVGTVVSTLTALALGADRTLVRSGMFGFNGGLVAVALLYFLQPDVLTWSCVIIAAACSTIVMAAMLALFEIWKLPVLTAPFVLTSLCMLLGTARFGRLEANDQLPVAELARAAAVEGVVTASTVGQGIFNGIAQVFFQGNLVTGMVFAVGLAVASRLAFVAALVGSLAGLVMAWGMGAAEPAICGGAFGFNSVLVGIALAGVFLAPTRSALAYALFAAFVTPFVVAAVAAVLEPHGMPTLTLPFVIVTWVFLLASRMFPRVRSSAAPAT